MTSKIASLLHAGREPVAVLRSETAPPDALMFQPGSRGCVIALLNAASQGRTAALSPDTVGCPGGRAGTGFQPFRLGNIEYFLSTGGNGPQEGEFYKQTPELAACFIHGLPSIAAQSFLLLKPYSLLTEDEVPGCIVFLVNADELSALVTLANYDQPTQDNVEIKFGAGCAQTFLYPLFNQDSGRDVCTIGLTDPSARKCLEKDLLAFSIPYRRFLVMEENAPGSFLSHETWQTLLKRKQGAG